LLNLASLTGSQASKENGYDYLWWLPSVGRADDAA